MTSLVSEYYQVGEVPNILIDTNPQDTQLHFAITYTNDNHITGYFIGILYYSGTNILLFMFTPNNIIQNKKWLNVQDTDVYTLLNGLKYLLYVNISEDPNQNIILERTNIINQQICNSHYHNFREKFKNTIMQNVDINTILNTRPILPKFVQDDAYLINVYQYEDNIVTIHIDSEYEEEFNNQYINNNEEVNNNEVVNNNELSNEEPDSNIDNPCPVCYVNKKNYVVVPCGHLYCGNCIHSLNNCAICRGNINMIIKTF